MIADDGGMEAHLIHQRHHRVGRNLKHVIDGVTRTVVARRENQQVGIEGSQRVGHKAKSGKLLNGSMRVVDTQDMEFTTFLSRKCQCHEHQQR